MIWLYAGTVLILYLALFCVYVVYGVQKYRWSRDRQEYRPIGPKAPNVWQYMSILVSGLIPGVALAWIVAFLLWGFFSEVLPRARMKIRGRLRL